MRLVLALGAICVLASCSRREAPEAQAAADPAVFSILAGSELKDFAPAMEQAARAAGVEVRFIYSGTLDIVERVASGEKFDAILPPNGAYPTLALATQPVAREKLFYSHVALGVKQAKAAELGWDKKAPAWSDVAKAAGAGKLRYAMTNPTASNTGMSALFAVACAVAGKSEDLRAEDVDAAALKAFLSGQQLTAGSSGWLADAFVKESARLDAMVNYEAVLLQTNAKLAPADQLSVIYPRDGVISADYPLMLMTDAKRPQYDKLVQAFKAVAFQRDALPAAFLRPVNPEATPAAALPKVVVSELAFPNRLEVIDAVLSAYQSDWRRPSTSILVLDVSGSMSGQRLSGMRDALLTLGGADLSRASSRYARFQERERVVLITFSDKVSDPSWVSFDSGRGEAGRKQVRDFATALNTDGGTAVYSALAQAEQVAAAETMRDPDRFVSVLLLTDGESNAGLSFNRFREQWQDKKPARVFPILFGEGNVDEMKSLADLTGGRTFDARKTALAQVFKEIRGYQ